MIRAYLTAFQIGVVAGMRSMMAPALVSHKLSTITPKPLSGSTLQFMTSPKTATTLAILAGGELIGDKLPNAPDRTGWPQILGRLASGALSGAALAQADGHLPEYGGLAGALGAAVGSFTFFHLRHWLTHEKNLPDPLIALTEDALAFGAGLLIIKGPDAVSTAS